MALKRCATQRLIENSHQNRSLRCPGGRNSDQERTRRISLSTVQATSGTAAIPCTRLIPIATGGNAMKEKWPRASRGCCNPSSSLAVRTSCETRRTVSVPIAIRCDQQRCRAMPGVSHPQRPSERPGTHTAMIDRPVKDALSSLIHSAACRRSIKLTFSGHSCMLQCNL